MAAPIGPAGAGTYESTDYQAVVVGHRNVYGPAVGQTSLPSRSTPTLSASAVARPWPTSTSSWLV